MPIRSFKQLKYKAMWLGPKKVVIAAAANADILVAAREAQSSGLAYCILIDEKDKLEQLAETQRIDIADMTTVDIADHAEAAETAMRMARAGEADVVMKGSLATALFMKAALDRDTGLRTGKRFSHVAAFDILEFGRLLLISDGGINIAPDIYQKIEIVQNCIDVAHKLGVEEPKVAILAASEFVSPKIPTTMDAANLAKMADRGQIRGGVVDGPLALDNAISEVSAHTKRINSPIEGQADVLIVPDIEAGNLLVKAITYFGHAEKAGVVVGGYAPIVLTSRADSHITKLVSIALGILLVSPGYRQVKLS